MKQLCRGAIVANRASAFGHSLLCLNTAKRGSMPYGCHETDGPSECDWYSAPSGVSRTALYAWLRSSHSSLLRPPERRGPVLVGMMRRPPSETIPFPWLRSKQRPQSNNGPQGQEIVPGIGRPVGRRAGSSRWFGPKPRWRWLLLLRMHHRENSYRIGRRSQSLLATCRPDPADLLVVGRAQRSVSTTPSRSLIKLVLQWRFGEQGSVAEPPSMRDREPARRES